MKGFLQKFTGKLTAVLIFAVAAAYIISQSCQLTLIRGESMSPTYHDFQFVLVNRKSSNYQRGDVVLFYCEGLDTVLIKRIIAYPGDTAQIRNGFLYVNNSSEGPFEGIHIDFSGTLMTPVSLGEEQYLVLGDNLDQSRDSRYEEVGIITEESIRGKLMW